MLAVCIVCEREFQAVGRGSICSPDCRRARRRAYDAGVAATTGDLPAPSQACVICGAEFAVGRGCNNCCSAHGLAAAGNGGGVANTYRYPAFTEGVGAARKQAAREAMYAEIASAIAEAV